MKKIPEKSPGAPARPPADHTKPEGYANEAQTELDDWIALAQEGDEEAIHRLMLLIMPRVRNGVRYLVRGDAIDDLVQDVLVTVLKRLDSYRGTGRFESWVDGITLRVVIGRTRKQRTDERRFSSLDDQEVMLLHRKERYATSRQLVRALDQIPDAQREALVMHHVFGLTAAEVAAELKIPHETARSRLRSGMSQLRALLRIDEEQK